MSAPQQPFPFGLDLAFRNFPVERVFQFPYCSFWVAEGIQGTVPE